MWTRTITIVGFEHEASLLGTLELKAYPISFLKRTLGRLGSGKIRYTLTIDGFFHVDLILLSGTLPFLMAQISNLASVSCPVVGTVDGHFHQRFKFGRPGLVGRDVFQAVKWYRVRHETVGGASLFVTAHAVMNCGSIQPHVTAVRRTIGEFINHQSRPNFLAGLSACTQPPLLSTDRVSPLYWSRPVAFNTHFYSSGWGIRSLTSDELAAIFSFPVRLRLGGVPLETFDCCTPVQLLLAILHPVLSSITDNITQQSESNKRHKLVSPTPLLSPVIDEFHHCLRDANSRSWIPAIGRWLPHSWIEAKAITPGAAKRDDAAIPTYLWDRRLQLLYPFCTDTHLACLRTWLLCKVRRNCCRSLCTYLSETHGSNWASTLSTIRASLQEGGGSRHYIISLHGISTIARCTIRCRCFS